MQCPCNINESYQNCCQPYHQGTNPQTAEKLMRARYSAFVIGEIDYIINTTVPAQQSLLNRDDITQWSQTTDWQSLSILEFMPKLGKHHAQVKFEAFFMAEHGMQSHKELSTFVNIKDLWYFIDPTPMEISNKSPCFCQSGQKYKHCCGKWT